MAAPGWGFPAVYRARGGLATCGRAKEGGRLPGPGGGRRKLIGERLFVLVYFGRA